MSGISHFQYRLSDAAPWRSWTASSLAGIRPGANQLQVRAIDRAGNPGTVGAFSFSVDTTPPPSPVPAVSSSGTVIHSGGVHYVAGTAPVDITWNAVTDAGVGLSHYLIQGVSGTTFTGRVEATAPRRVTVPPGSYAVVAVDRLGHRGTSPAITVREAPRLDAPAGVAYGNDTVRWDSPADSGPTTRVSTEVVITRPGTAEQRIGVGNAGAFDVRAAAMAGEVALLKSVPGTARPYTLRVEVADNFGRTVSSAPVTIALDNRGYSAGVTGPGAGSATPYVGPGTVPSVARSIDTDVDGDALAWRVFYRPVGGGAYTVHEAGTGAWQAPDAIRNGGAYEWYVEIDELWDHDRNAATPYQTVATTRWPAAGAYRMVWDTLAPIVGVSTTTPITKESAAPIEVVVSAEPGSSGVAAVTVARGAVSGRAVPGVVTAAGDGVYRVAAPSAADREALRGGTAHLSIAVGDGAPMTHGRFVMDWWPLPAVDGAYTVATSAVDRAGNQSGEAIVAVVADRRAPAGATYDGHTHGTEGAQVAVTFVAPEGAEVSADYTSVLERLDGDRWTVADTNLSVERGSDTSRYTGRVAVAELPADVAVRVRLVLTDRAGNGSTAEAVVHTLPRTGAVSPEVTTDIAGDGSRGLRFVLDDPGVASAHWVTLFDREPAPGVDPIAARRWERDAAWFEYRGAITPHGAYWIRIVGINGSGDEGRTADTLAFVVPNIDPDAPEGSEAMLGGNGEFRVHRSGGTTYVGSRVAVDMTALPAHDREGDPILYGAVFFNAADEEIVTAWAEDTGPTTVGIAFPDGAVGDGEELRWRILARDGFGSPVSEQGTRVVTADMAPPTVVEGGDWPTVLATRSATFALPTVTDATSGVEALYRVISHEEYTRRDVAQSGETIPLPEGIYAIDVHIDDMVGNRRTLSIAEVRSDRTAPSVTVAGAVAPFGTAGVVEVTVSGADAAGPVPITDDGVPFPAESALASGIVGLEYAFGDAEGGEAAEDAIRWAAARHVDDEVGRVALVTPEERVEPYWVAVRTVDRHGNRSEWRGAGAIVVDRSAPRITDIVMDEPTSVWGGVAFFSDPRLVTARVEAEDAVSGVDGERTEYWWYGADGGVVAGPLASPDRIDGGLLAVGTSYRLGVRVTDRAGNRTEESVALYYETPPAIESVLLSTDETVVPGSRLGLAVVLEATSVARGLSVALADASGATIPLDSFGDAVWDAARGALWIESAGGSFIDAPFVVPIDLDGGAYTLSVRSHGVARGESGAIERGITVDAQRPGVEVVVAGGTYVDDERTVAFSWRSLNLPTDNRLVGVEYTVVGDGVHVAGPLATDVDGATTVGDITLVDGSMYTVEVTASFEDGSAVSGRSMVIADRSAPVIDWSRTEAPRFTPGDGLALRWAGEDPNGAIAGVRAHVIAVMPQRLAADDYRAITGDLGAADREAVEASYEWIEEASSWVRRTSADEAVLRTIFERIRYDLTGAGIALGARVQNAWIPLTDRGDGAALSLSTGDHVRIELTLDDRAGNRSRWESPRITIDNTIPEPLYVTDGAPYAHPSDPIGMIFGAPSDWESGITEVWWTHRVDDPDFRHIADDQWRPVSGGIAGGYIEYDGSVAPRHGERWYFAVKAVNGAGLSRIMTGDGIVIDETAPRRPVVGIVGHEGFTTKYLSAPDEAIEVMIDTSDLESGVEVIEWRVEGPGGVSPWSAAAVDDILTIIDATGAPFSTDGRAPTVIAVRAANAVGLISTVGTSVPVVVDRTDPVIAAIAADSPHQRRSDGRIALERLAVQWESVAGGAPVVGHTVTILSQGVEVLVIEADEASDIVAVRDEATLASLPEGRYDVAIMAYAASSRTTRVVVPEAFVVDRTEPTFSVAITEPALGTVVDERVAMGIVTESVGPSGIARVRYRAGTAAQPERVTGGWREGAAAGATIDGFGVVPHGGAAFVEVQIQNGVGIWRAARSVALTADHEDPVAGALDAAPYINRGNAGVLGGISFTATDDMSPLTAYELTVIDEVGTTVVSEVRTVDGSGLYEITIEHDEIAVGAADGAYRVAVRVADAVSRWSDAVERPFIVDATPPVVTVDTGAWRDDEAGRAVINEARFTVPYEVSEAVAGVVHLVDGGATVIEEHVVDHGAAGVYTATMTFGSAVYGAHGVRMSVADRAGNEVVVERSVRHNRPPVLTIAAREASARPGEPIALPEIWASDGDGVAAVEWRFGDGGAPVVAPWNATDPAVRQPTHRYYQDGRATRTDYTARVRVADEYGRWSPERDVAVTVENTRAGVLYVDEYWSGDHAVTGEVVVPTGVRLTIDDGARIAAEAAGSIRVAGRLEIPDEGANRTVLAAAGADRWGGITVEGGGRAYVTGAHISGALRAVTTLGGTTMVSGTTLFDNDVGVHVLGGAVRIASSRIEGAGWYGVKEDDGGRPVVVDTVFRDNGYDYYADGDAAAGEPLVDMAWINGQTGNGGNRHE